MGDGASGLVRSTTQVMPNYAPEECPICKEGKLPLVHLGSRKMKQEAKQTL